MAEPLIGGNVAVQDILLAIIPMLLYFSLMFSLTWIIGRFVIKVSFQQTVTLAFTAASNNFELALAACTAIFGTASNQAVASVLGPLIEIPVMLLMVKFSGMMRYEVCDKARSDVESGRS